MKTLNALANEGFGFAVVKIDETDHWQRDIAEVAGQIFGVYIVDLTEPTNCCELSVSYPCEQLKNFFPNPPADLPEDTLAEYELSGDYLRQDIMYLNGNGRFDVAKLYKDEGREEVFEYEMGNPPVC